MANLWQLLGASGVLVELEFLPPYSAAQCQKLGRHGLAGAAHGEIRVALGDSRQN